MGETYNCNTFESNNKLICLRSYLVILFNNDPYADMQCLGAMNGSRMGSVHMVKMFMMNNFTNYTKDYTLHRYIYKSMCKLNLESMAWCAYYSIRLFRLDPTWVFLAGNVNVNYCYTGSELLLIQTLWDLPILSLIMRLYISEEIKFISTIYESCFSGT